jgi:hypothetical protein
VRYNGVDQVHRFSHLAVALAVAPFWAFLAWGVCDSVRRGAWLSGLTCAFVLGCLLFDALEALHGWLNPPAEHERQRDRLGG